MKASPPPVLFDPTEADRCYDAWRFSCGPAAICALLSMAPETLKPHLGDFPTKGYLSPTMTWATLRSLARTFLIYQAPRGERKLDWPEHGIVRVQWDGPWCLPGVPMAARYRQTHWVASWRCDGGRNFVFDINGTCAGWLSQNEWTYQLVPWLTKQIPRVNGKWWMTHSVEVKP